MRTTATLFAPQNSHFYLKDAAKYGALSNETGTVEVEWQVIGDGPDARFRLDWRERSGPPVAPPSRRGFGTSLIERSIRAQFGGTAKTDYRPDGVAFTKDARMGDAALMSNSL